MLRARDPETLPSGLNSLSSCWKPSYTDKHDGLLGGGRLLRTLPLFVCVLFLASALAYSMPSGDGPDDPTPLASDWTIEVVDSFGYVGFWNSIAVDANGIPHMSYFELLGLGPYGSSLKYAKWTGTEWGNETVETVDTGGGFSSIALDSNGNPHIGHSRGLKADHNLGYAKWEGGTWSVETVDAEGDTGCDTSLALDANDWPRISYERRPVPIHNEREHMLKHAAWNGSSWNIEVVDVTRNMISETSIAVDSAGNSHVSHGERIDGNWTLKYVSWNGGAWNIEVVDADASVGIHNELALDGSDRPHIAYYDITNKDLKYAWWNGNAWNISVVDSDGWVGGEPSIAIDSNDRPHIAYFNTAEHNLKYASWNVSVWNIETVDFDGVFQQAISITLDQDDLPHISYTDWMNFDLKYASKAELPSPSGSVSFDLDPDTLNLKSEGRWVTAYLGTENASVFDIDMSSVLLQESLPPERWDYQDDVLMLKFNRHDLIAMLEVGESVEIKLTGRWEDGMAFEAYDHIRVINPEK
jgi:hypothetical protein